MPKTKMTKPEAGSPSALPGRRTLLLVISVFLLPVVSATYLYVSGWRPTGKSLQYGELVQPARPVGDAELTEANGAPYQLKALRGKWALVYFSPLPCTPACQNNLYKMQQVRLTQGRDATRVERVLIVPDGDSAALRTLVQQYPGLIAVRGTRASLPALMREFVSSQGTALDVPGRVYLLDPIGNLVLSYAADADPSGMRKDLARLLRLSQVG
jgi:cytochrome oxidase Cu insertion factor (SCO1/SenC/PrrC family)